MNNYERIKAMTIDEMAEFFSLSDDFQFQLGIGLRASIEDHWNGKPYMPVEEQDKIQINGLKQWLQKESEGNNAE